MEKHYRRMPIYDFNFRILELKKHRSSSKTSAEDQFGIQ